MSEMAGVEVAPIDLTEIVGDLEIPCEYHRLFKCGPSAATWAMFGRCPEGHSAQRLVCEPCKDRVLVMPDGLVCPSGCGSIVVPARHIFVRVERL